MTAANVSPISDVSPESKPKKKALAAAAVHKAEAEDGFVIIEQCGIELNIPMGNQIPFQATLRFMGLNDDLTPLGKNQNADLLGTQLLLGPQQWAAFLAKNPTVGDFEEIGNQLQALSGN